MKPLSEFFDSIRVMPRAVWVIIGGQFINRFGSFVHPFLALYLSQNGIELGRVAWVLGAMSTGQLCAPLVSGYLSDAIGRRNTILVALIGGAVSMMSIYYAPSFRLLVLLAFVHGFFAFLFGPAAKSLISDLVSKEHRVMAFALLRLAINTGFAAGPAVAGLLFSIAPLLIFVGDVATTLIFALLALGLLPHGLRSIGGRVSSFRVVLRSWEEVLADMRLNGPFLQLFWGTLFMAIAFVQAFTVLSIDATQRGGLSTGDYGLIMSLNGVLIMLFELPIARAVRAWDPRRVLVAGFALVGLGCASFAWADTFYQFAAAMSLYTLGEMLSLPVAGAYGSTLAPEAYRGRYFGVYGCCWALAGMTGSSGLWFYDKIGVTWWICTGCAGLFAGAIMLLRWPDRRAAIVET